MTDTHRDDDEIAVCGKLAIVRSILDAEKNSVLYLDPLNTESNFNYASLEEIWYKPFFQIITENCEKKGLSERLNSIVLIVFNYDRCVEHYLYYALQNYYGISKEESADLVRSLKIYHPYGKVGSLPWSGIGDSIGFGVEPQPKQLLELSSQIKTFTEGIDPEFSEITPIKTYMANADRLVFLGFAFHKKNMLLITPDSSTVKYVPKCYATTYGISDSDQEVIRFQIGNLYISTVPDSYNVSMAHLKCNSFFYEFWRSLAF